MSDLIDRQALLKQIDIDSDGEPGYYGDTWKFIDTIKSMPPATQLSTNLAEVGTDLISRQAAIDIERNATVDTNPSHFEAHQKFTQFMDDAEISSFGRWQWSNGFNAALTAVGIDLKKLPSAQPERIKGRWILAKEQRQEDTENGNYMYNCSNCDCGDLHSKAVKVSYCWNCGADMRGEQNG